MRFNMNQFRNPTLLFHFMILAMAAICLTGARLNAQEIAASPIPSERIQTAQSNSDQLLESQLRRAGDNLTELKAALDQVDTAQHKGMEFLILHMPENDLKNLSAKFLLENVRLAYEARARAPWEIPDDIFLNDVLPYANVDEPRDPWRLELSQICWPLVENCKSPAEAAQALNKNLFQKIEVKYSTARKRANQSPRESMDQGLASCTGLSIILSDACRSIGVPARLAGIPNWKNKRGNHTWIEVWDQGWHYTGAAEPSDKGLDHAWFAGDAALADPNSKEHSIYAVSYRNTNTIFPMVWSPSKLISAENVTRRYLSDQTTDSAGLVNVMIRVWNPDRSQRVVADVVVSNSIENNKTFSGSSRSNTSDMNDMLTFQLQPDILYSLKASTSQFSVTRDLQISQDKNQVIEVVLQSNQKKQ